MQKTLRIIGNVLLFIIFIGVAGLFIFGGILSIFDIVKGLIYNTKATVLFIGFLTLVVATWLGCNAIHKNLIKKNEDTWSTNKEFKYILDGLAFISFLSLLCPLFIWLIGRLGNDAPNQFDLELQIKSIPFLLFSFWAYLSLMFLTKNALLIVRAFLIFLAIVLISLIITGLPKDIQISYFNIFGPERDTLISNLLNLCIIAISVKGIVITFSAKFIKTMGYQKTRFADILLIVILCFSIISFRRLDMDNKDNINKEYPALNQSN